MAKDITFKKKIVRMIKLDFFKDEDYYFTRKMYDELARIESGEIKKTTLNVEESYTYRIVYYTLKSKKKFIYSKIFEKNAITPEDRFDIIISVLENNIDSYYQNTLYKENNKTSMSDDDITELDEIYTFIQKDILGYDDENGTKKLPPLSKNVVLRLKGLHEGKLYENKKVKATNNNYSYQTIKQAFDFCKNTICNAFKQKRFRDDEHKCFYAIAIVSKKVVDIDYRKRMAEKRNKNLLIELEKNSSSYEENTNKKKEEVYGYTKKSNSKNRDRYKDFW